MLEAIITRARAGLADRLLLEVRENNEAAIAFYTGHGFVEIDRRARYYRDGTTAVVMRRNLRTTTEGPEPAPRISGIETAVVGDGTLH